MVYTISQAAEKCGLTAHTLRYYDKMGLLPFINKSSNGTRHFKDDDFNWLSIIICLKETGMPIKEIKEFIDLCLLGDATIEARLTVIKKQKQLVDEQIKILKKHKKKIDYKVWYYQTAKEAGTLAIYKKT